MAFCPQCGSSLPEGAASCPTCGALIPGAALDAVEEVKSSVDQAAQDVQTAADTASEQAQNFNAQAQNFNAQPQFDQQYQQPYGQPQFNQPYGQGNQYNQYNQFNQQYQQPYGQPYQQAPVKDLKDHTEDYEAQDISENKVYAMLPYLFSIVGVIVALLAAKESPFVKFHIHESLKIAVCTALCAIIMLIPFVGTIVGGICMIILLVCSIIQFVRICQGKAKEAPIVSNFGFLN